MIIFCTQFHLFLIPNWLFKTLEFSIANAPQKLINQYPMAVDFDKVTYEQVTRVSPINVSYLNMTNYHYYYCINVSSFCVSLIPRPQAHAGCRNHRES